jgi:hypothetical protein
MVTLFTRALLPHGFICLLTGCMAAKIICGRPGQCPVLIVFSQFWRLLD